MSARRLVLSLLAIALPSAALAQAPAPERDTVLVFDVSGSMWGRIEGRPKIEIAREAATSLVDALPRGARLGVVAYGHRRAGDCADIETVMPVAAIDRTRLGATLAALTPRGKTPITEALREAAKTLDAERRGGAVILVTDGIETCKGDPCALAAELKRKNVGFVAHVVGFDVGGKADRAKLACIAERTGGTFVPAGNAGELAEALRRTAQAQVRPVAQRRRIALKATEGGRPVAGANFSIVKADDETVVADGVNGAIELAPGRYVVSATAGVKNGATTVEVTARAPAEIVVPLTGSLPTAAVRPVSATATATTEVAVAWEGPDRDGDYIVIAPADGSESEERAYAYVRGANPAKLRVPGDPGDYEVRYILAQPHAVIARAKLTVTPATATLDAPPAAVAGSMLEVRWTGPKSDGDYIAIARPDAPNAIYAAYAYVREHGAPVSLHMPGAPGAYELRYVTEHEAKVLARRAISIGRASAAVSGPTRAMATYPIEGTWTGPAGDGDYVAIASPAQPAGEYVTYAYTTEPGLRMRAPSTPGVYELRYIQHAADGDKVLARAPLAVEPARAGIEAPARTRRASEITVRFTGPAAGGDFIAIAKRGAEDGSYQTYGYVNADGAVTFATPEEPGAYELRYVAEAERLVVIARRPLQVD